MAMVLPVSVMTTVLRGGHERAVELSVAGPKPAGDVLPTTSVPILIGSGGSGGATAEEPPPSPGAPSTITTTTEVRRGAAAANDPVVDPMPPRPVLSTDNPVISGADPSGRTTPAAGRAAAVDSGAPTGAGSPVERPPSPDASSIATLRQCGKSDITITVSIDKPVYARGERVSGSGTLAKNAGSDCRLERVADGRVQTQYYSHVVGPDGKSVAFLELGSSSIELSSFKGEPDTNLTGNFTWENPAVVCSGLLQPCGPVPAPAGTYAIVFEWMGEESGNGDPPTKPLYVGKGTFEVRA